MLKALDPFYPCLLVLRAIGFFCLLFLFSFFFAIFFVSFCFFTAFSCFKNQFHDFSDPQ
ncbi:uncharacterized protein DS421_7g222370 [Arachis hypogaea]|nr:uncharacterized protein DS421_7g222370 [Arachis hypogaea]